MSQLGGCVRGFSLLFLRTWFVPVHPRALRQKPDDRLIANAPLEQVRVLDGRLTSSLWHDRRSLWFGRLHCLLFDTRSKHGCTLLSAASCRCAKLSLSQEPERREQYKPPYYRVK
jgi:hypothetical protein